MQLGPITIVRQGKVVMMKNEMTKEQHAEFVTKASADYEPTIKEMQEIGRAIAERVALFDPIDLLMRAFWEHMRSLVGIEAEAEMGQEQNESFALIKFIQTCVVSKTPSSEYKKCEDEDWAFIKQSVAKLFFDSVLRFQIANTAYRTSKGLAHKENDELFFLLVTYWVSLNGERYLNHEEEHLTDLLAPHDETLKRLFGVSGSDIAKAMHKMMVNLVSAPLVFNDFIEFKEKVDAEMGRRLAALESSGEEVTEEKVEALSATVVDDLGLKDKSNEIGGKLFGSDLFDIEKVTGLPATFLEELSLAPGQNSSFFTEGKFSGTPLQRLPTRTHPILKFDKKYYVFHPHLLSDHLYRNIQAVVLRKDPTYAERWNKRQKEVSERLPFEILRPMLPGGVEYRNFQFRGIDRSGAENWIECDGIIIFDGFLIKGGR